jgi:hypothetical protein
MPVWGPVRPRRLSALGRCRAAGLKARCALLNTTPHVVVRASRPHTWGERWPQARVGSRPNTPPARLDGVCDRTVSPLLFLRYNRIRSGRWKRPPKLRCAQPRPAPSPATRSGPPEGTEGFHVAQGPSRPTDMTQGTLAAAVHAAHRVAASCAARAAGAAPGAAAGGAGVGQVCGRALRRAAGKATAPPVGGGSRGAARQPTTTAGTSGSSSAGSSGPSSGGSALARPRPHQGHQQQQQPAHRSPTWLPHRPAAPSQGPPGSGPASTACRAPALPLPPFAARFLLRRTPLLPPGARAAAAAAASRRAYASLPGARRAGCPPATLAGAAEATATGWTSLMSWASEGMWAAQAAILNALNLAGGHLPMALGLLLADWINDSQLLSGVLGEAMASPWESVAAGGGAAAGCGGGGGGGGATACAPAAGLASGLATAAAAAPAWRRAVGAAAAMAVATWRGAAFAARLLWLAALFAPVLVTAPVALQWGWRRSAWMELLRATLEAAGVRAVGGLGAGGRGGAGAVPRPAGKGQPGWVCEPDTGAAGCTAPARKSSAPASHPHACNDFLSPAPHAPRPCSRRGSSGASGARRATTCSRQTCAPPSRCCTRRRRRTRTATRRRPSAARSGCRRGRCLSGWRRRRSRAAALGRCGCAGGRCREGQTPTRLLPGREGGAAVAARQAPQHERAAALHPATPLVSDRGSLPGPAALFSPSSTPTLASACPNPDPPRAPEPPGRDAHGLRARQPGGCEGGRQDGSRGVRGAEPPAEARRLVCQPVPLPLLHVQPRGSAPSWPSATERPRFRGPCPPRPLLRPPPTQQVRHPHVSDAIERDFQAMMWLASAASALFPSLRALRLEDTLKQFEAPLHEQVRPGAQRRGERDWGGGKARRRSQRSRARLPSAPAWRPRPLAAPPLNPRFCTVVDPTFTAAVARRPFEPPFELRRWTFSGRPATWRASTVTSAARARCPSRRRSTPSSRPTCWWRALRAGGACGARGGRGQGAPLSAAGAGRRDRRGALAACWWRAFEGSPRGVRPQAVACSLPRRCWGAALEAPRAPGRAWSHAPSALLPLAPAATSLPTSRLARSTPTATGWRSWGAARCCRWGDQACSSASFVCL